MCSSDLLHTYKRDHGFFVREEVAKRFTESTILAFYGSAVGLEQQDSDRISALVDKLTSFIGHNLGVLTGGGGGVMRLATEQARNKGALTGACFLELEAQPPELGVDFFNTFQESSRHFRQKWFEAADFCIFNVGGVGTLEEVGIELCNLKLGIRPRTPYVFFNAGFWGDLRRQLNTMIRERRAPAWMARLSSRPVSSAMPNDPSSRLLATSSLVLPWKAISKSWITVNQSSIRLLPRFSGRFHDLRYAISKSFIASSRLSISGSIAMMMRPSLWCISASSPIACVRRFSYSSKV